MIDKERKKQNECDRDKERREREWNRYSVKYNIPYRIVEDNRVEKYDTLK